MVCAHHAVAATTILLLSLTQSFTTSITTTTTTSTTTTTMPLARNSNNKITLSLPLVPQHVQERRRRRLISRHGAAYDETNWERHDGYNDLHRRRESTSSSSSSSSSEGASASASASNNATTTTTTTTTTTATTAHLFQGYGTHYVDLWCGQPNPQRQTVIVDTGSGYTAFPCVGCKPASCGVPQYHLDPLYDPSQSNAYTQLSCGECSQRGTCHHSSSLSGCKIGMSYQEGSSWQAWEVRDTCYVGGLHTIPLLQLDPSITNNDHDGANPFHANDFAFPLRFGCQMDIKKLFVTQLADGIMGMDQSDTAFWYQMSQSMNLIQSQFSLCFSRSPIASRDGSDAGAMTLGGTDDRFHQTPMVYSTTASGGSEFYDVTIRQVYLRHGSATNNGSSGESARYDPTATVIPVLTNGTVISAIVDSGTTVTYLSQSKLISLFGMAWKELVGQPYTHNDMILTDDELHNLPTILIQLVGDASYNNNQEVILSQSNNGMSKTVIGLAGLLDPDHPYDVIVAIPASHYFEYDDESGTYTSQFYIRDGNSNVLGANTLMGHNVHFDISNQRIGWSESTCDYIALVQPYLDDTNNNGALPVPTNNSVDNSYSRQDPEQNSNTPAAKPQSITDNTTTSSSGSSSHETDHPKDGIIHGSSVTTAWTCSATCRFGLVTAALVGGVMVVLLVLRRDGLWHNTARRRYHMARTELELGEWHSNDDDGDEDHTVRDDGCFTNDRQKSTGDGLVREYRDRPTDSFGGGRSISDSNRRSRFDDEEEGQERRTDALS